MMQQRNLTVRKTARYFQLGELGRSTEQVWFICHGYGHLASYFLKHFQSLNHGRKVVVAPEGLSRFYLQGFSGRVGASWMTREDRLQEIQDYVDYLDAVSNDVFNPVGDERPAVVILGFSQGTATACRWLDLGKIACNRLILWAGLMPPEIDLHAWRDRYDETELTFVVGNHDEYGNEGMLAEQESQLQAAGLAYQMVRFDGGHEIHQPTLLRLAQEFETT